MESFYGSWKRFGITEKMIPNPYLLAEIPQDLNGLLGNVLAADVYAVVGSKKRKRSELAIAIDRQGINIFDVSLRPMIQGYSD